MKLYKLMIETFCIFDKILSTQIIFTAGVQRDPAFKKVDFKKVRHSFLKKVSSYKKVFSLKNVIFL